MSLATLNYSPTKALYGAVARMLAKTVADAKPKAVAFKIKRNKKNKKNKKLVISPVAEVVEPVVVAEVVEPVVVAEVVEPVVVAESLELETPTFPAIKKQRKQQVRKPSTLLKVIYTEQEEQLINMLVEHYGAERWDADTETDTQYYEHKVRGYADKYKTNIMDWLTKSHGGLAYVGKMSSFLKQPKGWTPRKNIGESKTKFNQKERQPLATQIARGGEQYFGWQHDDLVGQTKLLRRIACLFGKRVQWVWMPQEQDKKNKSPAKWHWVKTTTDFELDISFDEKMDILTPREGWVSHEDEDIEELERRKTYQYYNEEGEQMDCEEQLGEPDDEFDKDFNCDADPTEGAVWGEGDFYTTEFNYHGATTKIFVKCMDWGNDSVDVWKQDEEDNLVSLEPDMDSEEFATYDEEDDCYDINGISFIYRADMEEVSFTME